MRFTELDIFGVYISPLAPMLLLAWLVTLVLRRAANRVGLLRRVWHPALFMAAIYVIVLSSIVLVIGS